MNRNGTKRPKTSIHLSSKGSKISGAELTPTGPLSDNNSLNSNEIRQIIPGNRLTTLKTDVEVEETSEGTPEVTSEVREAEEAATTETLGSMQWEL